MTFSKYKHIKKVNAYNLQEILVVLVIIGILLLLAMPSLMKYITRARATEAQLQLKGIHNDQTTYRLDRKSTRLNSSH